MLLVESKETFAARFLDFILDLALHARRRGSLPGRETEDVRFGELQICRELIGLLKVAVAFAGEAGYDIGADGDAWDQLAGSGDNRLVARAVIAAGHAAGNVIGAALDGPGRMTAHAPSLAQFPPFPGGVFGVERRNPGT